jgi:hypothetical protein
LWQISRNSGVFCIHRIIGGFMLQAPCDFPCICRIS